MGPDPRDAIAEATLADAYAADAIDAMYRGES